MSITFVSGAPCSGKSRARQRGDPDMTTSLIEEWYDKNHESSRASGFFHINPESRGHANTSKDGKGATMPNAEIENTDQVQTPDNTEGTESLPTSQEELDAIISRRLKKERIKNAEQLSEYESLKQKAEEYDKMTEAAKTDLEKAIERAEKAEAKAQEYEKAQERARLVQEIANETGVPADLLRGDTHEELEAHANQLKPLIKKGTAPVVFGDGQTAKPIGGKTRDQFAEFVNQNFS